MAKQLKRFATFIGRGGEAMLDADGDEESAYNQKPLARDLLRVSLL